MEKGLLAVFCIVLVCGAAHAQPPSEWASRGIGGGGAMFAPSFSPHNPNELYVASDMSGLFHTTDLGASWEIVPFQRFQGYSSARVQFTDDPDVLYCLDHSRYTPRPVRSLDGGNSWQPLDEDPASGGPIHLFVDPADAGRLIVSDKCNLYISDDGGKSFERKFSSGCDDAGLHIGGAFFDGDRVFLGTSAGLLVSTDSGESFARSGVSGLPEGEKIVSFSGAREGNTVRLYALVRSENVWAGMIATDLFGSHQEVYALEWGEPSWVVRKDGLPARPSGLAFIATSLDNIDVAYAAGRGDAEHPLIFKTTDGGETWTRVLKTTNNENIATGWQGYHGDSHWWWGGAPVGFTVAPDDPNRAAYTDYGFCHVTADGGESWNQAYVSREDANPPGSPTPKKRTYRGAGLEVTSCWQLVWLDRENIWACFTDIRGIRSADRGLSWSFDYTGHDQNTMYRMEVHPETGVVYAATSTIHDLYQSTYLRDARIDGDRADGKIIFSRDNGRTWKDLHDFDHPVFWLALDPSDGNTMYASVANYTDGAGGVYVCRDLENGASSAWTKLPDPPRTEGHPATIVVLRDGSVLSTFSGRMDPAGAFTPSSGVFIYSPDTNSWEDLSHPDMQYWTKDIVVDPHDPEQDTWYVGVFSGWGGPPNDLGGLFRTTDRGSSWTRILTVHRVTSCTIHPDNAEEMYVTTETDGLLFSSDIHSADPTFSEVSGYPFRQPERVFFNPYDHNEIWVTSFGNGLRVGRTTTTGIRDERRGEIPEFRLMGNHPNPFNLETTIAYSLGMAGRAEMTVYSILGQKVTKLVDGFQSEGRKSVRWEGVNSMGKTVSNGVYLYQLKADGFAETRKMTLVK